MPAKKGNYRVLSPFIFDKVTGKYRRAMRPQYNSDKHRERALRRLARWDRAHDVGDAPRHIVDNANGVQDGAL